MADQVAPWLAPSAVVAAIPGIELDGTGGLPADVEQHRAAAAAYVERQRRDLVVPPVLDATTGAVITPATFTPPADVVLGAAMLTARLKARQGSPQGLAGFAEFGPAAVLRTDPDVARLLGIGNFGKPVAL